MALNEKHSLGYHAFKICNTLLLINICQTYTTQESHHSQLYWPLLHNNLTNNLRLSQGSTATQISTSTVISYKLSAHRSAGQLKWSVKIIRYEYEIKLPSVLWRCWLGGRKGIRPVKKWVVGYWRGYLSGARCRLAYGPADATATHCLLLQ